MTSRSLWAGIETRSRRCNWLEQNSRSCLASCGRSVPARGAGELFPPVEGIAEEAYAYGDAVGPDPECDLALGHVLEGTGFLVHDCCPWPDCEELSVLVELQGQKVPAADIGWVPGTVGLGNACPGAGAGHGSAGLHTTTNTFSSWLRSSLQREGSRGDPGGTP